MKSSSIILILISLTLVVFLSCSLVIQHQQLQLILGYEFLHQHQPQHQRNQYMTMDSSFRSSSSMNTTTTSSGTKNDDEDEDEDDADRLRAAHNEKQQQQQLGIVALSTDTKTRNNKDTTTDSHYQNGNTTSSSSSNIIDDAGVAFSWDTIDTEHQALCGNRKCFFRTTTTPTNSNYYYDTAAASGDNNAVVSSRVGYLIANECTNYTRDTKDYYGMLQHSWSVFHTLEQKIQHESNNNSSSSSSSSKNNSSNNNSSSNNSSVQQRHLRHLYLAPPQRILLPPDKVVERLNSVTYKGENHKIIHAPTFYGQNTNHNYCRSRHVIIQKVRVAPEPNMIVRCYFSPKGKKGIFSLQERKKRFQFKQHIVEGGNNKHTAIQSFLQTFTQELDTFLRSMEEIRNLWYDFQFMIDYHGRIYHIDIDRMEQTDDDFPKPIARARCIQSIRDFFPNFLLPNQQRSIA